MTDAPTRRPSGERKADDRRAAGARRAPAVIRDEENNPFADVTERVAGSVGAWLRSPALDFYALIVLGLLLLGLGLTMVLSSSAIMSIASGHSAYSGLWKQGRFAIIGIPLLLLASRIPPATYRRFAWPLLLIGYVLQLLVFVPGLGINVQGNQNWIGIAGMSLQPSEMLKLALCVWLGAQLTRRRDLLAKPAALVVRVGVPVMIALGLVLAGGDLGTAMVMGVLVGGALWVAGVPKRWFAVLAALAMAGVLVMAVASPNRMGRIGAWLHGTCTGSLCDQSRHGLMALAEGGWWGVGLGESRQKWGLLPASDNDYIFAVIGEELGLIGTLCVLALFVALAYIMLRIMTRSRDMFVQIAVGAIFSWLLVQAVINMMVVVGLLPVLGVPLPFISAGGSALIASMLALGVLLSFARHEPDAAAAIRARSSRVRRGATVHAAEESSAPRPVSSVRARRLSPSTRAGRAASGSPRTTARRRTRRGDRR